MSLTMRVRLPSHFETRACEWMLAFIELGWGAILLTPYPIFRDNIYFSSMALLADQYVWGAVALLTGILHLTALYWNGTKQKSPHLRAGCSAIGALLWFQTCLGFFAVKIVTPGWAVYSMFFIFSVYNIMRAMWDARASDDKAKAGGFGGGRSERIT